MGVGVHTCSNWPTMAFEERLSSRSSIDWDSSAACVQPQIWSITSFYCFEFFWLKELSKTWRCLSLYILQNHRISEAKSEFQKSDKGETALAAIPALLCRLPPQVWECWAMGIQARTRSRARLPRLRSNTHSEISNECIFQPLESIRFNISTLGGAFIWLWRYSLVLCLDSDK